METIRYGGWDNCIQLTNNQVDLIVTTDVGPRIIYFGLCGGENEFKTFDEMLGKQGGSEWRVYGGHRLWHAPEDPARTYAPDNEPVTAVSLPHGVHLIQSIETETGIQKELEISLDTDKAAVTVVHRLRNTQLWPVELAVWALSVMAPGGVGLLPLPPRGPHPDCLLPTSTLALWPYTNLADPRWQWGERLIRLQQQDGYPQPQKLGVHAPDGWAGYLRDGRLFLKATRYKANGRYPDLGSNLELFTNNEMLEVETLSPLVTLPPQGIVSHTERWYLLPDVAQTLPEDTLLARITETVESNQA